MAACGGRLDPSWKPLLVSRVAAVAGCLVWLGGFLFLILAVLPGRLACWLFAGCGWAWLRLARLGWAWLACWADWADWTGLGWVAGLAGRLGGCRGTYPVGLPHARRSEEAGGSLRKNWLNVVGKW